MLRPILLVIAFGLISPAFAEEVSFETTLVGNSKIDLNWDEKDRIVHVYSQFQNFDISDHYFLFTIIQSDTGRQVAENTISVYSTATSPVNFNTIATYMVNDRDICNHEMDDEEDLETPCHDVTTGDYEFKISTIDGKSIQSEKFTINDSR